jgi:hypothetical protein
MNKHDVWYKSDFQIVWCVIHSRIWIVQPGKFSWILVFQVPTTIGREKQCNPFLRTSSPEIKKMLSIPDHFDDARVLEVVRRAKDNF